VARGNVACLWGSRVAPPHEQDVWVPRIRGRRL
jgi:hypothetical protein